MPQIERVTHPYRYTAEGAVTQYAVVVEGTADKQAKLPAAADAGSIVGVALEAAATGAEFAVAQPGDVVRCIASAAIARGAPVSIADTAGKVKTAAPGAGTNTYLVGFAKSAAAASGDHVHVHILPSVMQG